MTGTKRNARPRTARLATAVVLAVTLAVGSATVSSARPSQRDLADARAGLAALNDRLDLLIEQYDQARETLKRVQVQLADARAASQEAQAEAAAATARLSARAVAAYEGGASQLELLLGATSFADFSDRIEFLGTLAAQDADDANQAQLARERADRASGELTRALQRQRELLATLNAKTAEIKKGIADQQALVDHLKKELAAAAPVPAVTSGTKTGGSGGSSGGHGGGGGGHDPGPPPPKPPPPPPPVGGSAQIAVNAAYSVLGVPYKWGGSDPSEGFDCSGLTMWSWGQAGVSLPHSSAMQYDVIPHVSVSDLQPGDLLFFYTPIHHVGMYIGPNQMIDANHPGDVVAVRPIMWDVYVGAGRPG